MPYGEDVISLSGETVAAPSPRLIIQGLQPPTGLNVSGKNKATNWKAYKQLWENYAIVTQLEQQSEEYRVALFLYSIGPEAVKTYNSFDISEENWRKLPEIMKCFDDYAIGETNETYERYVFNSRNQKDEETIDKYVAELRTLTQSCNFCTCLHDSLIRDRIVLGIRDGNTRKRLLRQSKLTLQKCIDIVKSDKVSSTQMKSMDQGGKGEDVHKIKASGQRNGKSSKSKTKQRQHEQTYKKHDYESKLCDYCGQKHKKGRDNCAAWGQTCNTCGKRNHFSKMCRKEKAHQVCDQTDDDASDVEFMYTVTVKPETLETVSAVTETKNKEIYANMLIDRKRVWFHINCSATANVIPRKYITAKEITPTERVLQMWNKTELRPQGTCRMTIKNPKNNRKYSVEFMVVKERFTPLLGAKVIQQMGLIEVHKENFEAVAATKAVEKTEKTAQEIIEEYSDVFDGELGTLEGRQRLAVDPTVLPNVALSRRVPFAVKEKLKGELERLTGIGVLVPVDEPTDWVSNLVIATKASGDLRLCLDPKQLNKALKRERYALPVIDDVLPDLSKAKVFTKVNARNGYWHVQLDDKSNRLTTFDTPFGRYRWKRLPFGVSVASKIFQKRLNQALD